MADLAPAGTRGQGSQGADQGGRPRVYNDVAMALQAVAERSLQAHLENLVEAGEVIFAHGRNAGSSAVSPGAQRRPALGSATTDRLTSLLLIALRNHIKLPSTKIERPGTLFPVTSIRTVAVFESFHPSQLFGRCRTAASKLERRARG
jgi:hypothetical protein